MKPPTLIAIALIGLAPSVHAQGLLLYKEHGWEQDSEATPLEYRTAAKFNTVYNVVSTAGVPQRIMAATIVKDIVYSELTLPTTLTSQTDIDRVSLMVATLQETITKWPASRSYLQKYLSSDQTALDYLKKGYVLVNGKLMPAKEYQGIVSVEQRKAAEAHQKEEEAKHTAALAKADELEKTLASLQAEAAQIALEVRDQKALEKREFFLQRKLPKSKFEDLYKMGPYVYQGITRGGDQCVVVSWSIATSERRFIELRIRPSEDIDVTEAGGTERVSVFIEAAENDAALKLEDLHGKIETATRELRKVRPSTHIGDSLK